MLIPHVKPGELRSQHDQCESQRPNSHGMKKNYLMRVCHTDVIMFDPSHALQKYKHDKGGSSIGGALLLEI